MWTPLQLSLPFLLAGTNTKYNSNNNANAPPWPPQSPSDLTSIFAQEYTDLERPGSICRHVSPTIRFSYVSPPVNGTSTWRQQPQQDASESSATARNDGNKPLALYVPGLDGYGISAHQYQFDDLAHSFHFWRLTIAGNDRSEFRTVVAAIVAFVQELSANYSSPVTLIGESCGGVLASAAALQLQQKQQKQQQSSQSTTSALLQGLVLVNPATSFEETNWDLLVPALTSLRYLETNNNHDNGNGNPQKTTVTPYGIVGSLTLSAIIPDNDQYRRIADLVLHLSSLPIPPTRPSQLRSVWDATASGFVETENRLPPALLSHRVDWLTSNAGLVRKRMQHLHVPTLVVAGQQDKLLPSRKEAEALAALMPNCEALVVPNRGHFVLDQNVNLTEAIEYSVIDPFRKRAAKPYDPILDWKLPPHSRIMETIKNSTTSFRDAHSPVFVSTTDTGRRILGLGGLPRATTSDGRRRPLLFVGNHQFAALDLRILAAELYEQRGIFARGLAHPINFAFTRDRPVELGRRKPGILDVQANPVTGDFEEFGAVEVTPKNYYRLMESGQDALLFPGGAREALSGRTDYPLLWPNKTDFVRTAAKFDAIVVPLSAVGMIDSVSVLAEPHQLVDAPLLGDIVRAFNANLSAARYDETASRIGSGNRNTTNVASGDDGTVLGFPIAIPKLPARNYFLFGKPFDLASIDPKDKDECRRVYYDIQDEVRKGLDDLVRARA
jgi:pimeloyl-ACP methyl ester carboxylesterase/1-acyl-sn-glycerol-3-phosphate acyltransferase